MELYEGLLTRRSIRKYNPEKTLTREEIEYLVKNKKLPKEDEVLEEKKEEKKEVKEEVKTTKKETKKENKKTTKKDK